MLDSLTAAMALVPLLYSRNRMFDLFADPVVRRARVRARLVRGLVRFVGRTDAEVTVTHGERMNLRYVIRRLRLERSVQLSEFELALLRTLLAKGPRPEALAEVTTDRARVDAALALLPKEQVSSVA